MPLTESGGPDLRDYLTALRRRKWLVVACTALVVATALVLSFLQQPVYEARARLVVDRDRSVFASGQAPASDPNYVETQMQVITSQPVRDLVQARLNVAPRVSTSAVGTTSIVQISAESSDARQAAAIANAYAEAYLEFRRSNAANAIAAAGRELQGKIDALQRQIDGLGAQLGGIPPCTGTSPAPTCAQRDSLQQDRDALVSQQVPIRQKLDQLQVDSSVGDTGTQVVTPAAVPGQPIRPTPVRNGLLALGVGLLFGTALALLFEYLDDSVKGKEDLEKVAGNLAVLAMIPSVAGWKERDRTEVVALSNPTSAAAEAYRTLRTSIRFLAVDSPLRTIQITSPSAGEGKTTTSANLAVALARAGERVVLVSCDLRRPRLHEFFGLSNKVGFTSVLLGEAPLASALQTVDAEARLSLLASGPLPPNPSELLSSARAGDLLAGLAGYADTVIIDSPPVLPVTDAVVLSSKVDGTLVVVAAGSSTGKQVTRAIEMLRQVAAPLVGTVLNNVSDESAYGYSYGYYTAQEAVPDPSVAKAPAPGGPNGHKAAEPVRARARRER